jgi:hypothetical protein
MGVKRPGREADHSPPSSAEVKECVEVHLHSPISLHGVVLLSSTGKTLPLPPEDGKNEWLKETIISIYVMF